MGQSVGNDTGQARAGEPAAPERFLYDETAGWLRWFFSILASPLVVGLAALAIYALAASRHGSLLAQSEFPYYNYLADAFLHGQLGLRLAPVNQHDLVHFAGQLYLYWPPMPAVLLMPLVAIFGVGLSDVAYTLVLGALNVALAAELLRQADLRGAVPLSASYRGALALLFAFGTVHFVLAVNGRVWFTGQLIGTMFVLLAYISALRWRGARAFVFTGLALAGAALTRNPLLLAGIWPAWFLIKEHLNLPYKKIAAYLLMAALPILLAVGLLAWYNWARFGNPMEVGLDYHRMASRFQVEYGLHGPFSLHYLPTNLYYQFLYYPLPVDKEKTFMGGSLFLLSPLFFALFSAFTRQRLASAVVLVVTILLVEIPILLLMGTGWVTFGPRYTLDFIAPLLLLTGLGLSRWPPALTALALLTSIAHYLFGALLKLP